MEQEVRIAKRPFYRHDPTTTIVATIGVFLLSQVLAGIIIWLYPALKNWTDAEATNWLSNSVGAQFAYVLIAEIIAVSLILQLLKRAKIKISRIGLIKPRWKDALWALIAYGMYFVVYLIVIVVATQLLPGLNSEQEQQVGFEAAKSTLQLIMTFISLVILPPIAEEIMFRGFLFTSLRAKFRIRYAVIITSVLFGIAHLQFGAGAPLLWIAAIDTFVLSCFLCYLRERTGSLWSPIFLHALKNSVAFAILFGSRF